MRRGRAQGGACPCGQRCQVLCQPHAQRTCHPTLWSLSRGGPFPHPHCLDGDTGPRAGGSHSQKLSRSRTHPVALRSHGPQEKSTVGIKRGPQGGPTVPVAPPPPGRSGPLARKLSSVLASALGVCRGGSCHFSNTHHLSSHWSHWPPALSHLILSVNTQQGTHNYPPNPERRTHSHRRRDFLRSQLRRQAET